MIFSSCYITVKTLMKHPEGLTLEELSERINDEWPGHSAAMWLTCDENYQLNDFVERRLVCIRRENERYYFDRSSEHYYYFHNHDIDNRLRVIIKRELEPAKSEPQIGER